MVVVALTFLEEPESGSSEHTKAPPQSCYVDDKFTLAVFGFLPFRGREMTRLWYLHVILELSYQN